MGGRFVTKDELIYISDGRKKKRNLRINPAESLEPADRSLAVSGSIRPVALQIQDRSLYVSMVDNNVEPTEGGVYEYRLPPELQLE